MMYASLHIPQTSWLVKEVAEEMIGEMATGMCDIGLID